MMEELTGKECVNSVQALLHIVECPVCYMVPQADANLSQCVLGHIICSRCRTMMGKKNECPLCRQKFSSHEPTIVKQILNALPKICKNLGCELILKPGDNHEFICPNQTVTCKLCPSILRMKDGLSHLERAHKALLLESNVFILLPHIIHNHMPQRTVATLKLDQVFWTSNCIVNRNLQISVEVWLTSEQLCQLSFLAKIELIDESGNFFSFTKRLAEKKGSKRILTFDFVVPESTRICFQPNTKFSIRVIIDSSNNNHLSCAPSTSSEVGKTESFYLNV